MNSPKEIFFVLPKGSDSLADLYACFDAKDKIEAFVSRFKSSLANYQIIQLEINPSYQSNKYQNPYYVAIGKYNLTPYENYIADMIEEANEALNEKFEIVFYPGFGIEDGRFYMHVFADDEKAALEKVIAARDAAILKGEWQNAWDRHQLTS
ncbi:hypothetical protein ABIE26_001182 [Pedobacter africanus]|uniref:Uncharacterized protein n=1 Tax=Pedobacter africanus TaxID=151894 RepID=A0ACC6KT09_9SPHI|nr:hypothetical protein [Pedobacter africanus]MDR6782330.1 hypothetical protein [Pedobacter africanus]